LGGSRRLGEPKSFGAIDFMILVGLGIMRLDGREMKE
jgi:hypothetical protein